MDVLVIAFGILAAIWILVLLGSPFFGPRHPKSTTDSRHDRRDDIRYTGWVIGGVVVLAIVIAAFVFTSTGNR
jgi:hypothetical protein